MPPSGFSPQSARPFLPSAPFSLATLFHLPLYISSSFSLMPCSFPFPWFYIFLIFFFPFLPFPARFLSMPPYSVQFLYSFPFSILLFIFNLRCWSLRNKSLVRKNSCRTCNLRLKSFNLCFKLLDFFFWIT